MKNKYYSIFIFLLTISVIMSSCGNKASQNAGALKFDSIQVNETAHLFGDTAKPACNLIIKMEYAIKSSDNKLKDSLNSIFLSACFGDKYKSMTPKAAVAAYTEKYIKDYRSDLEPMYNKDEADKESESSVGAWYSYYKEVNSHVQLYTKHLLVYRTDYNEYTGGAHGMYTSNFLNMDLHTLHPVHLDDLFVSDYQEALTDLLWNQLMADNKVTTHEALEDLGYASTGDLGPTENFYLAKNGITFYFNVYDITPYAMGPVEITLPYDIMDHLLKKDVMVLNEVRE